MCQAVKGVCFEWDDSVKAGLPQFEEIFTMILCATESFKR